MDGRWIKLTHWPWWPRCHFKMQFAVLRANYHASVVWNWYKWVTSVSAESIGHLCNASLQCITMNDAFFPKQGPHHYGDVIMDAIASQITSLTIVYSIVYSDVDQRKHQSPASLAFVRGIHRRPGNSPHKWPVTRKVFPFDDVIMMKIMWKAIQVSVILSDKTRCAHAWFEYWNLWLVLGKHSQGNQLDGGILRCLFKSGKQAQQWQ